MRLDVLLGFQLVRAVKVTNLALIATLELLILLELLPAVTFPLQHLLLVVLVVMMLVQRMVVSTPVMVAVLEVFVLLVQLQPVRFGLLLHLLKNVIVVELFTPAIAVRFQRRRTVVCGQAEILESLDSREPM